MSPGDVEKGLGCWWPVMERLFVLFQFLCRLDVYYLVLSVYSMFFEWFKWVYFLSWRVV